MRRTPTVSGAFVLYDRLRVDWRQFFNREDAKLMGEDRLSEAILTFQQKSVDAEWSEIGGGAVAAAASSSSVGSSSSSSDAIYETSLAAWKAAIHEASLATSAKRAASSSLSSSSTTSSSGTTSDAADVIKAAVSSERLTEAATHMSRYMRIALEEDATVESIPRRLGQPLSVPEAKDLSQLFTELHAIDHYSRLLLHITEDLGQALTSRHYHDLLRLFIFGRDKSCTDRTMEAIVRNEFVTKETFARMIDAHHIFCAPGDALRASLGVIHSQVAERGESLLSGIDGVAEVLSGANAGLDTTASSSPSSSTVIPTSYALSSLLHHTSSSGAHHGLLSLVIVVWMRALGAELSNWDWCHVAQSLVTRPQDYAIIKGVMEALESPPTASTTTSDDGASSSSSSSSSSSRRLASGYVSVQSLLYTLHRQGVLSDAAYGRLRALVRESNLATKQQGGGGAAAAAVLSESAAEKVFSRFVDTQEGRKLTRTNAEERPAFYNTLKGMTDLPAERRRASLLDLSNNSSTAREQNNTAAMDALLSTTSSSNVGSASGAASSTFDGVEMNFMDLKIHQSLGYELEALLAAMIQNLAVESALLQQGAGGEGMALSSSSGAVITTSSSSAAVGGSAPSAASVVGFIAAMKAPIFIGFLNRRFADPHAMCMAMLEQACTQRAGVGPWRENGAHLYHHYALMVGTMRNDVEALGTLVEAERVGKVWEGLYGSGSSSGATSGTSTAAGGSYLLKDALATIERVNTSAKATTSAKNDSNNTNGGAKNNKSADAVDAAADIAAMKDLARRVFGPRTRALGANQHPTLDTPVDKLLAAPFLISPNFLFDVAMVMPNVPFQVASQASTAFINAATRLLSANVTTLEPTTEERPAAVAAAAATGTTTDDASAAASPSHDVVTIDGRHYKSFSYPLLRPNDKGFLSAYSMYYVSNTAEAQASWATIRSRVEPHQKLPPRAVKKMIKIYAEVCARNPPRNCKFTQKGYEERLRWALYLESRETALMLFGSGKEAKDMMKHLYYNQNKLPIVRDAGKIAADEERLLPLLVYNPIQTVHSDAQAAAAAQRELLAAHADRLAKANAEDSRAYATDLLEKSGVIPPSSSSSLAASATTTDGSSGNSSKISAAAGLKGSLAQSAFYAPAALHHQTGLEDVAESVLVGGSSRLTASSSSSAADGTPSSSPSVIGGNMHHHVAADGRLIEAFATEKSWISGYQASLVPDHLHREDVFNHYPHITLANRGALTADTVAIPPLQQFASLEAGTEEKTPLIASSISIAAGANSKGKGKGAQQQQQQQQRLIFDVIRAGAANTAGEGAALSCVTSSSSDANSSTSLAVTAPLRKTFVYGDGAGASSLGGSDASSGGFTEDPFLALWGYVNEVFSAVDLSRERPWLFEDTEMFLLLLKCLIYRLDWENATKFVLLFTQTASSKAALAKMNNTSSNTLRVTGYSEALRAANGGDDGSGDGGGDADDGSGERRQRNANNAEWSFALDHATAEMFDAIGDPQGFLPFKTATKLFDGRLVNKSNRMGRVHVKPLMDAAGVQEDTSEFGDGTKKKRRFV